MKQQSLILLFLLNLLCLSALADKPDIKPLSPHFWFVQNQNQWSQEIKYRAEIPNGFLFLKQNSLQYSFYESQDWHTHSQNDAVNKAENQTYQDSQVKAHAFEVKFLGANPSPTITRQLRQKSKYNFFLGNKPEHWASDVSAYADITYQEIYEGVNLHFYTNEKHLKYEFILDAHTNPNQIQVKYKHASKITLEEGYLVIKTSVNTVVEQKPVSYQLIDGKRIDIPSRFVLKNNILSFEFPNGYNPDYKLVIDPTLVFSTFSGSQSDNFGTTATFDKDGKVYSGGIVFGKGFPVTLGTFSVEYSGEIDMGILKYSADGKTLEYATYLGGRAVEFPHSMLVDNNNDLIIFGTTSSDNFPITNTAFDRSFAGGSDTVSVLNGGRSTAYLFDSDIVISKLNSTGNTLKGSTFFGGSETDGVGRPTTLVKNYGDEFRGEIIVDEQNNIYIASQTRSRDIPNLKSAISLQRINNVGLLAKFDSQLSTMLWGTVVGSPFSGSTAFYSLQIAKNGDVYVVGGTSTGEIPTHNTAMNKTYRGSTDGIVLRFDKDGNQLGASYLGTSFYNQAYFVDLDDDDNVYVFGQTDAQTGNAYPTTQGVYKNENGGQFIHKLDPTLSTTLFSTTIGTNRFKPNISPTAFMVSKECGNIYLAGWGGVVNTRFNGGSNTKDLPTTASALRQTTTGSNFYMMILTSDAQELAYATFFGTENGRRTGDHVDGGTSRFDKKTGTIYQAACACNGDDFPVTEGVWSETNNSVNCNNAVFKIDLNDLLVDYETIDQAGNEGVYSGCAPLTLTFDNRTKNGEEYLWTFEQEGVDVTFTDENVTFTFTQAGVFDVKLEGSNKLLCNDKQEVVKKITVLGANFSIDADKTICFGDSIQINAFGGEQYRWTPNTGLSDTTSSNPIASPKQTTTYQVNISAPNGCTVDTTITVNVLDELTLSFDATVTSECGGLPIADFKNTSQNLRNFLWIMGNGDTLFVENPNEYQYENAGKYEVTLLAENEQGCQGKLTKTIAVDSAIPPNVITPNGDGKNDFFEIGNARSGWSLEIADRWGKVIYTSDDYQNDWGDASNNAIYYYILISPDGNECRGTVQVLRE